MINLAVITGNATTAGCSKYLCSALLASYLVYRTEAIQQAWDIAHQEELRGNGKKQLLETQTGIAPLDS
jgi:hypothetical protein